MAITIKTLDQYIAHLKSVELLVSVTGDEVNRERTICAIESDSRNVCDGVLFVALPGVSIDGSVFIPQAIAAGGRVIITEQKITPDTPPDVTWIMVQDAQKALAEVASLYYDFPERQLTIIGVTGTNGKTTTATLCYQLWSLLGMKTGLLSTVCIRIGEEVYPATHTTPGALDLRRIMRQMVDAGCRFLFMEVSSHSLVQQRVHGLNFSVALFTNLTRDHLDYHGSYKAYIAAKRLLFDHLSPSAYAVINADDRNASVMVQNSLAQVKTYAMHRYADFMTKLLEQDLNGSTLEIDHHEVVVRLLGNYNAYNLTAVYAVGRLLLPDLNPLVMIQMISMLKPVNGRFDVLDAPQGYHVVIDYAHTPDALENLLKTVSELQANHVRVVVGAGGDRDKGKRPEMARIAYSLCDHLILTSDNPRSEEPSAIIADMLEGIPQTEQDQVECIVSRAEAIRRACCASASGDLVVIAGKGHETYQEIQGVRHHFDDKEQVLAIFSSEQI